MGEIIATPRASCDQHREKERKEKRSIQTLRSQKEREEERCSCIGFLNTNKKGLFFLKESKKEN